MTRLRLFAAVVVAQAAISLSSAQRTFSAAGISLTIQADGRVSSLLDTVSGQQRVLALPAYYRPLCELNAGGVQYTPTAHSAVGNRLSFTFGGLSPAPVVDIDVTSYPSYLVFSVAAVSNAQLVDELRFLSLDTDGSDLGILFRLLRFPDPGGSRFVGIYGLDPYTRTEIGAAGAGGYLWATAYRALPLPGPVSIVGRRVALFTSGVSQAAYFSVVRQIEADQQIPLGVVSREIPGVARSAIFFRDVPADQQAAAIQLALDAGVGKIVIWAPIWADIKNRYAPNPRFGSWDGLRAFVAQCRAVGLRVGAHVFPSIIPINSIPYVYEGCDPRLRRNRTITLAGAIPAGVGISNIQTTTPPTGWPLPAAVGDVRTIVIGNEIFAYTGLDETPPTYGFTGVTRSFAQNPAARAARPAGATLQELVTIEEGGFYEWAIETGGVEQHNRDVAAALDQVGFDFVYADNIEDAQDPIWFVSSFLPFQLYSLMTVKPLWMEASGHDGVFSWPLLAVGGQIDYQPGDFRDEVDRNVAWAQNPIFTYDVKQLGWAQPSPNLTVHVAPDEFEYMLAKGLANDMAAVVQMWPQFTAGWPHKDAHLALFRAYETLRLGNYFPQSVKDAAKQPGVDFMLFSDSAGGSHLLSTQRLDVANGAYQVVGFVSDATIGGARQATLWPPDPASPQTLYLPNLTPADLQVRDYGGTTVPVSVAGQGYVSFPVDKRLYLRLTNVPDPVSTFRNARLTLQPPCPGDLNGDRVIDSRELGIVLSSWLVDGGGDYDGDGDTDSQDLGVLLSMWGTSCP